MRRETVSRWFFGSLLIAGVALALPVGASADDVNDNRKHDAAYREAYSSCMRSRGYAG